MVCISYGQTIKCPHCDELNSEGRQYCASCGKLIQLTIRSPLPQIISPSEIIWVLIGGFSVYLIFRYLLSDNYPFILFVSALTSFVMMYRLLMISSSSGSASLAQYFPYWKQFFVTVAMLIWIIEILLILSIELPFTTIDDLLVQAIILYTFEFIQGYALGILIPLFISLYLQRGKKGEK